MLGRLIRSAFGILHRSRGRGLRRRRGGSPESQLARGALRAAKKRL